MNPTRHHPLPPSPWGRSWEGWWENARNRAQVLIGWLNMSKTCSNIGISTTKWISIQIITVSQNNHRAHKRVRKLRSYHKRISRYNQTQHASTIHYLCQWHRNKARINGIRIIYEYINSWRGGISMKRRGWTASWDIWQCWLGIGAYSSCHSFQLLHICLTSNLYSISSYKCTITKEWSTFLRGHNLLWACKRWTSISSLYSRCATTEVGAFCSNNI